MLSNAHIGSSQHLFHTARKWPVTTVLIFFSIPTRQVDLVSLASFHSFAFSCDAFDGVDGRGYGCLETARDIRIRLIGLQMGCSTLIVHIR